MSNHDAIRPRAELKMTVICAACGHQYGRWRPRCDACGTAAPAMPKSFNPPKVTHVREPKRQCIACRQRNAKERCPSCNERIHRTCLGLHLSECRQFVSERDQLVAQMGARS